MGNCWPGTRKLSLNRTQQQLINALYRPHEGSCEYGIWHLDKQGIVACWGYLVVKQNITTKCLQFFVHDASRQRVWNASAEWDMYDMLVLQFGTGRSVFEQTLAINEEDGVITGYLECVYPESDAHPIPIRLK